MRCRRARAGGERSPAALLSLLALLGLAAGTTGCSEGADASAQASDGEEKDDEEEDAITVKTGRAVRRAVSDYYSTSASLRPDKRAVLTSRTSGVVHRLTAEEGDVVEAGAPVAVLEDAEQRIAASKARAVLETKRREHERARELHSQGLLSDEAHGTAEREAREAQHASDLAELELSRTVVRAPFSGTVLKRLVDVGASVSPGTEVYELADLEPLYLDVTVPERHVARLSVGQEVRLTSDAAGTTVGARVERVAPLVDAKTGTVKVTAAAESSPDLRPGSFVRVDVVTDTHEDALVVPRTALVAEGRRWAVYRVASDGVHVERVAVSPGLTDEESVEILAAEGEQEEATLQEGDEVVTLGARALSDGAKIDVDRDQEAPLETSAKTGSTGGAS